MVFPAPVWPTMAMVWPGSMVNETSLRIHSMSVMAARSLARSGESAMLSIRAFCSGVSFW